MLAVPGPLVIAGDREPRTWNEYVSCSGAGRSSPGRFTTGRTRCLRPPSSPASSGLLQAVLERGHGRGHQHRAARVRELHRERLHPDRGPDPRRRRGRGRDPQAIPRHLHCARNRGVGRLWFIGEGEWTTAATVYVLASIGFSGAIVFYDALIVAVSPAERVRRGLRLRILARLHRRGAAFRPQRGDDPLAGHVRAGRAGGGGTPLLRDGCGVVARLLHPPVPPRAGAAPGGGRRLRGGGRAALPGEDAPRVPDPPDAGLFLVAYFFYIDGVHTIIRMAVGLRAVARLPVREPHHRPPHHPVRGLSRRPRVRGWRPRGSARSLPSTSGWRCTSRSPCGRIS